MTSVPDVFDAVDEKLGIARNGLSDVSGRDPTRKLPGLGNVVNFGVATTQALHSLRSLIPDFDGWYAPKAAEMRVDPLLRFFWELRIELFHKGRRAPIGGAAHIRKLELPKDLGRFGPPPPGAKRFFIGDATGGSGWEVVTSDGSQERVYVDLPGDIGAVWTLLPSAPSEHLGMPLQSKEIGYLCGLYVSYLEVLVSEGKRRFFPAPDKRTHPLRFRTGGVSAARPGEGSKPARS